MPSSPLKLRPDVLPDAIDLGYLMTAPSPVLDIVLPGLVRGRVGALVSPGGMGKSMWALQAALAISSGQGMPLLGIPVTQGKVLVLSGEDPEDVLALRLKAIAETTLQRNFPSRELAHLDYRNCVGRDYDLMNDTFFEAVCAQGKQCRLVLIDTLTRFHSLDENSASDMKRVMARLELLAELSGAAVLFLHHTGKSYAKDGLGSTAQAARGSSVLVDNARWSAFIEEMSSAQGRVYGISEENRGQYIRWNLSKRNYCGMQPDRWYLRSEGGALLPMYLEKKTSEEQDSTPLSYTKSKGVRKGVSLDSVSTKQEPDVVFKDMPETPSTPSIPSANNAFDGNW